MRKKNYTSSSEWYIARNENGELWGFNRKPHRVKGEVTQVAGKIGISCTYDKGVWQGGSVSDGWRILHPSKDWFPEITWKDEPVKIERVVTYKRIG